MTWLYNVQQPRVLHVFDRACNLIDSAARVVSLVTPEIGNGPFNLVVPAVQFSDLITPSSAIRCGPGVFTAGDLTIHTGTASIWPSRIPNGSRVTTECIPTLLMVLRELPVLGSLAGLVVDLPEPDSALERHMLRNAADHIEQFIAGLLAFDRQLCAEGAMGLAGLGGGLTPAGDDWIVGALIAAHVGDFDSDVVALAKWTAERAAQATTPLSAAWLRAVSQRRFSAHWHSLLDAIEQTDESLIHSAAVTIAREGHTSGCDALAGFVAILMAGNDILD